MKRLVALGIAIVMTLSLVGCGAEKDAAEKVKVGLICLHDEQSTYDLNFITSFKNACAALGVEYVIKTNIDESEQCLTAAEELVEDEGCSVIFGDSFGHETYLIEAAKEFPNVQFGHATGTRAHTEGLSNYHNAFASIYEGRYLAGIAAGAKINEMIASGIIAPTEALVGYVAAFPYAEVISGYTSFYLGVRSICPTATMLVQYTNSWYDEAVEYETASTLIKEGCVVMSGHADSMGVPRACEENSVYNVSYNGSTVSACPNTFLVSSRINWEPYFEYLISSAIAGESMPSDWVGTILQSSVELTEFGSAIAVGTAAAIEKAQEGFMNGTLHVFDTSTFTINGEHLTSYLADVDDDGTYSHETEVIADGYFHESEYRSAPYFDLIIDGITIK